MAAALTQFRPRLAAGLSALLTACLFVAWLDLPANAEARPASTEAFAKGVNIANYLAYPEGATWPIFTGRIARASQHDLNQLAASGITFVRLPVEPAPFLNRPPAEVALLVDRLATFIRRATTAGLGVLAVGFPRHELPPWRPEDILRDPAGDAFKRYQEFLLMLAEVLGRVPGATVALGLMNEPQPDCFVPGGRDWTVTQRHLHRQLRAAAPGLTLVITPACWAGIDGLPTLDMAGYDDNTLVDVHFYEPFSFTHQGAAWSLESLKYLGGLNFPARLTDAAAAREEIARLAVFHHPGDRQAQRRAYAMGVEALAAYRRGDFDKSTIASRLDKIARWAKRQGIGIGRVLIGEFGALRPSNPLRAGKNGGRERWIEAVRRSAEANGFGWALWSWNGAFGLLANNGAGPADIGVVRALGLAVSPLKTPVNQGAARKAGLSP